MTKRQYSSANKIQIQRAAVVLFLVVVLLSLGNSIRRQPQDRFFFGVAVVESFVLKPSTLRFRRLPSVTTAAEVGTVLSPLLLSPPPSLGTQRQRQSTITPAPQRHSYLSASSLTTAPPPTAPPPERQQNQDAASVSTTNTVKEQQQQRDDEEEDLMMVARLPAIVIKERLMGLLLGSMKGTETEFRLVETYVNALEGRHQPAQTLGFFNLQVQGRWQLLFSTALTKHVPSPNKFRLRSVTQRVSPASQQRQQRPRNSNINNEGEGEGDATNNTNRPPGGSITNRVVWDLADRIEGRFDVSGTFDCVCSYRMVQGGARMMLALEDHVMELSKGSEVPSDVQGLVGRLHRTMPKELFDPTDHAVDTTYVDADIRIVRHTGPRLEGVRDIFLRETTSTSTSTTKTSSAAAGGGETE